jgi:tRNA(fMet)-specific endonuclease VapC
MSQGIVLDTGILILLVRGGKLADAIAAKYGLLQLPYRPLVSAVTHGEVWAFAGRNSWVAGKRKALANALENVVTLDIRGDDVISAYVEIDLVSWKKPKGSACMSDNDKWIAATARVTDSLLITLDKDFDHLHPAVIRRAYVDQRTGEFRE